MVFHFYFVENTQAHGGAAAPAKIVIVFAEHGDDAGVPGGAERACEAALHGNPPAEGGGGAEFGIIERGNQMSEPLAAGAAVGVGEDHDLEAGVELINCKSKIIYFFPAGLRASGDYDVGRSGAGR